MFHGKPYGPIEEVNHDGAKIYKIPESVILEIVDAFVVTRPDMFHPGRNVYLAAEIKKHVSVPVATIGGLDDPAG